MNENDILIELTEYIRKNRPPCVIRYDEADKQLGLPDGTSARFSFVTAACSQDFKPRLEITLRGDKSAEVNFRKADPS